LQKQAAITVVGSYNVGLVAKAVRLPEWGETVFGSGFSEGPGGKGSNQAVAAARLGARVSFIGCIGTDRYGDDAIRLHKQEGVDITHLKRTEKHKTGVGFVFLNEHGDNCIVVDPGANMELTPDDILSAEQAIDSSDVVLFQLESHPDTVLHAMKLARAKGKTVILNPAPAQTDLESMLSYATYVTPNETELMIMSKHKPDEKLRDVDYIELAKAILAMGPEAVIVTLGERGAMVVETNRHYHMPAITVNPVDTTGAGDSFNAALAVALGEGQSLRDAVQFACVVGAFTVSGKEVIPSLPKRDQLAPFLTGTEGALR
jgi:ribokinase